MKITQDVNLALLFLENLPTGSAKFVRVEDLAKQVGVSVQFAAQTVRKLSRFKLLSVKRGPGGGIFKPKQVSILAVITALGKWPKISTSFTGERLQRIVADVMAQELV